MGAAAVGRGVCATAGVFPTRYTHPRTLWPTAHARTTRLWTHLRACTLADALCSTGMYGHSRASQRVHLSRRGWAWHVRPDEPMVSALVQCVLTGSHSENRLAAVEVLRTAERLFALEPTAEQYSPMLNRLCR